MRQKQEVTLSGEKTSSSAGVLQKTWYNVASKAWTLEATTLESPLLNNDNRSIYLT